MGTAEQQKLNTARLSVTVLCLPVDTEASSRFLCGSLVSCLPMSSLRRPLSRLCRALRSKRPCALVVVPGRKIYEMANVRTRPTRTRTSAALPCLLCFVFSRVGDIISAITNESKKERKRERTAGCVTNVSWRAFCSRSQYRKDRCRLGDAAHYDKTLTSRLFSVPPCEILDAVTENIHTASQQRGMRRRIDHFRRHEKHSFDVHTQENTLAVNKNGVLRITEKVMRNHRSRQVG